MIVREIAFNEIVTAELAKGAVIRKDFPGFREDYLVIHCLIKKYDPKTFMEIGTSTGRGTKVICNAMGIRKYRAGRRGVKVYSIDVPPGTDPKILYPDGEDGHPSRIGKYCNLAYNQILANSFDFDFSPYYPIEGWFIDGKHNYTYVKNDTFLALRADPLLIIWHDVDIQGVREAIIEIMSNNPKYDLFKVIGTRVAFSVKHIS